MAPLDLPQLPAPHKELARHIAQHPEQAVEGIMAPYRKYEARLREVYAQDRQNPALDDPYINVVPLFTDDTKHITTRARDLSQESPEQQSKYIMALPDDKRRPHGSPATVADLAEFQHNFGVFSESSLVELDWSNVVAAGSSVVNCLLPVPQDFKVSKRKLREYYHEKFCPASDVDLFLYGLTHEQAIEKIKQIERAIRDALLNEVTVVRTKYAITIASQYPVRHVQIVLRVYKSISEILTGFDIDAAGGAYDGKQVYVTPRALGSFITQINHVDLSRRSPSYENRLSKYSHRNFEVYWPELDRSRVDPTIFERSFQRTLGLARLLVLERLPTNSAREAYLNKRRMERGRPTRHTNRFPIRGNIKDSHEDEVADWLSEEDISNYHTFTVPYGEKFHAKRIEKLCYTRDLLLNAEWNQSKDREVYLHRHPAFFGRVEDVIEDCCGFCPKPVSPEEIEVAGKEAEIYISGKVSFLIDDPGRQQIGSFNPLTEQDWTDMAYVGNTARLCQSIVDGDIDDVLNWLSQEDADPNKRDYTGRTPLQLAVMTSTPEIVKCLVDHGARLTARLADGRTALHLAAARGQTEMIKILMEKSIENEEAEEERQARRRKASGIMRSDVGGTTHDTESEDVENPEPEDSKDSENSDGELVDDAKTETDVQSLATGSFVKVKKQDGDGNDDDVALEASEDEPDYYQIDVLAWDVPCSPLHLAIAEGHEETVKLLCDYGADSILPVKFLSSDSDNTAAILTLTLALSLPTEKAKSMARLLLRLGATSSQADSRGYTAFQKYIDTGKSEVIDVLLDTDRMGVKTSINHLAFTGYSWNANTTSPLHSAVERGDSVLVLKLLNAGAKSQIDFDTWLKAAKVSSIHGNLGDLDHARRSYRESLEQPLIAAIRSGNADAAIKLLEDGADPNALTSDTNRLLIDEYRRRWNHGTSALDLVRDVIHELLMYKGEKALFTEPTSQPGMDEYLEKIETNTYTHWIVSTDVKKSKSRFEFEEKAYAKEVERLRTLQGAAEKKEAIDETLSEFTNLESALIAKGGKAFSELHPDIDAQPRTLKAPQDREVEKVHEKYKYDFSFNNDPDMNDARRDGYVQLMEAAWSGDLDRIKSMTLEAWGPEKDRAPLKMSISDKSQNSPFSVAFLKGHKDVAHAILEIVKAQWSAPEKENLRYKMEQEDDDDEDENDSEDSANDDDDQPRIVSENLDKTFTIEDIGKVSMQVKSHDKPLDILCRSFQTFTINDKAVTEMHSRRSLFVHVLDKDDTAGLKALLDMAQHFSGQKLPCDEEEGSENFTFPESDFRWAVENGKTGLLGLIIKRTGAGIPLDHLVKKSGVEIKKKPRYYQGLTVYGKKRKDWATAGRSMVTRTTGLRTPPLLHAALGGSLEGIEFFLSETPHRLYGEFGKSKAARDDPRLKHLKESPKGFERAISKWLGADNDLVIHCAVLSTVTKESVELLGYLVNACPEFIEKKTSSGDTPLMVACSLGRIEYVKTLLAAGADQSTRNASGENIVHASLKGNPTAAHIKPLMEILDSDLRKHLFLQRKSLEHNGTTPLHTWISRVCGLSDSGETTSYYHYNRSYYNQAPSEYRDQEVVVTMAKLLLGYSNGEELDMLNGAGETCLHTAVKREVISLVKVLVDFKPQLLLRENAVGRTPAEIAHDQLQSQTFEKPNDHYRHRTSTAVEDLINKHVDNFATESKADKADDATIKGKLQALGLSADYDEGDLVSLLAAMGTSGGKSGSTPSSGTMKKAIWDFCFSALSKDSGKRRLVSLNEANDVARRLGEKHTPSRYFSVENRKDEDEEEQGSQDGKDDTTDFVVREMQQRRGKAWEFSEYEAEKLGISKCDGCGRYHP
ncbi:hypothetical protein JDV02_001490 [Purpureocillium takamizusanense]|uniref:Ankyrin repeat protein n=1 Tax=Purpureocillium takamizusanense TaxID=2060973 RepID=A0A9Q8Q9I4_9HYPO|nr:uncharacterized protein JDV02_001490 [Purpureocillium takamizusanense]UNI14911.1 hypothetical protein JDV02_001490 [Purpureocillium takamizusanense]